jgi:hypothetical protein
MQDFFEIEIIIKIDADGNYEIGKDLDEVACRFSENISSEPGVTNEIFLRLKVPAPKMVEVEGALPASGGKFDLEIKQS